MPGFVKFLFFVDVVILMVLLMGALWSVAIPSKRIWPPPGRRSWQYRLTWASFYLVFAINTVLFFLDWNTWVLKNTMRFIIGIPLAIIGVLLVSWGIAALGARNTSGIKDGFVMSGPYTFTRNPQYLGDMVLFLGLSIVANSLNLWIVHILLIMVFTITPLAEKPWLEEKYGQDYRQYKIETSRFL
jgi:protein-S-isoprenylcysteine O-methyltransferase Ste14